MGATVELGILGPLEVRTGDGERAALGGSRQRAVLALLALNANRVVSVDRIIDDLWGEQPPATALHTIRVFVSRLRGGLGAAGARLITRPPGYVLELEPDELDAGRFERLYESARAALAAGRTTQAVDLLSQAERLWRGAPLADFSYEPFAQGAIARLEDLRLNASEDLIEARLALGAHQEVVPELEALVREHPFRERPWGQLMLALYRSGRQAQALEAFQQARSALVEELAVEPGEALRRLEQAILRQDPALDLVVPVPPPALEAAAEGPEPSAATEPPRPPEPAGPPEPVVRRTATVLVAGLHCEQEDDPEVARVSVAAARRRAEEIVAGHGGAFVAGLGGELVWVFGVPRVREDDALRALRAGVELSRALPVGPSRAELGPVTVRLAAATGEVVADSPSDLFGDPLSRALALAQSAGAGAFLVSDATRRLVAEVAHLEPLGSAGNEETWRLLDLPDRGPAAPPAPGPMVGRGAELERAVAVFERALATREAHLLTVLGDAGIGKSRLLAELERRLAGEATVLSGRCLSYGEGVAFWPLREALSQVADESRDGIRGLLDGSAESEVIADIVAAAVGLGAAEGSSEQLPWAVRCVLQTLAARGPLLLVIDDVHWAHDPLLDLVEYLVDWLRAPILVVCLGRPELLETRPGWGGGHARIHSLVLAPLDEAAALELLEQQLGEQPLGSGQREQILATAEGNPLFVEQLLRMSAEDPWWARERRIPGAIQTLLAARLDRLGPGERAFIEPAALIGREFWPSAVRDLLPAEARSSAPQHLRSLVHRGLIQPDRSILDGEDQLRFHHILIRDVAYRSTPKSRRNELHVRFAEWLAQRGDQYDEFVGYHLEQAVGYRTELRGVDATAAALAGRAAERLAAAGRRAVMRGDVQAGARLLRRAADMTATAGRPGPEILLDLGGALSDSGELAEAESAFQTALAQARELGADDLEARALIDLSFTRVLVDPSIPVGDMRLVAEEAIRIFERGQDHGGIARAWHHVAMVHWIQSHGGEMELALDQAMEHARRAGDRPMQARILGYLARAVMTGPRPADEAIDRCTAILGQAEGDVALTAVTETMLAVLAAMRGDFDGARADAAAARRRLEAVGLTVTVAALAMYSGWIELMAATPERALPLVQDAYEVLGRIGERHRRAMTAAMLGRLLVFAGDAEGAERYLAFSEEAASSDDVAAQTVWRGTRARLLAGDRPDRARELADGAVAMVGATDYLMLHAHALADRAEVLSALGQDEAARADRREADALRARKGITVPIHAGLIRRAAETA